MTDAEYHADMLSRARAAADKAPLTFDQQPEDVQGLIVSLIIDAKRRIESANRAEREAS